MLHLFWPVCSTFAAVLCLFCFELLQVIFRIRIKLVKVMRYKIAITTFRKYLAYTPICTYLLENGYRHSNVVHFIRMLVYDDKINIINDWFQSFIETLIAKLQLQLTPSEISSYLVFSVQYKYLITTIKLLCQRCRERKIRVEYSLIRIECLLEINDFQRYQLQIRLLPENSFHPKSGQIWLVKFCREVIRFYESPDKSKILF